MTSAGAHDIQRAPDSSDGVATETGWVAMYSSLPTAPSADRPILLIHSVNAAAGTHEVRPLFEYFGSQRPTYGMDLPGFGSSDRPAVLYRARITTDAVLAVAAEVAQRHGASSIDALAISTKLSTR
jgi:pimeloyl-ACP methyl ester carboxylesterase